MQLNLPHKELIIQGGTVTLKKKNYMGGRSI